VDQLASVVVRRATADDAGVVAHHRVQMFLDMGDVSDSAAPALREATERWLAVALRNGEYVGWLAILPDGAVAAGAGVHVRAIIPRPSSNGDVTCGPEALVVNVYTERRWRRRGIARRLMEEVLAWADRERLIRVVLHASAEGRPLYESLGFQESNEMRRARRE
jgi:GNAT superfamily N-acetyltransferase